VHKTRKTLPAALLLGSLLSSAAHAASDKALPLSLRELTQMEVTSVSRKEEKLSDAAAAVYVLTNEDIRRSGATSIVEALRMVPGVQVARSASGEWAVSARGFNDQFANKLLVLIDGRTVYTPIFSGVYWDIQDMLLDNVERVEVIRGPGATMWGSNAVNGVINIITKSAAETQGAFTQGLVGSDEWQGGLRYGGTSGDKVQYRVHAKHRDYDSLQRVGGDSARDNWSITQGGVRVDMQPTSRDEIQLFSDAYEGSKNQIQLFPRIRPLGINAFDSDVAANGGYAMAKWKREWSEGSRTQLQSYYNYDRRVVGRFGELRVQTFDADFQHALTLDARNDLTWGAGYRVNADDLESTFYSRFSPTSRVDRLLNGFVQDKYAILPEELFLTVGSKFEENNYTGFEFQPSARLSWLAAENTTLWTAVSRAVRVPSRAQDDISLVIAPLPNGNGFARLTGDRDAPAEELVAYETGFRTSPMNDLSLDVSLFYNDYDRLATSTPGQPFLDPNSPFGPYGVLPLLPQASGEGEGYGGEFAVSWQALDNWKLDAAYSYLQIHLDGSSLVSVAGSAPQHQFNVRSHVNLDEQWEFDQMLYYNDNLPSEDVANYVKLDLRVGWKPMDGVEFSLVGQNLLEDAHQEFSPFLYSVPTEVGRSAYGSVTLRF
jgi:iron complex outermembrane receptor protein